VRSPEQILADSNTIAVVGASRHPDKAAYAVPIQLRLHGWRVIPVNPYAAAIWDEPCFPDLASVPVGIDLVNVFRPSAQAAQVAQQAVAVGARALWLQQGIASAQARGIAAAGGLDYVEDCCMAVVRAVARLSKHAVPYV
jgi:hypothetical protein